MSEKVTVVATVIARPEATESVKTELLKMIAPTRAEHGCIEYLLHQDHQAQNVFIFYETWENMACLDTHLTSAHFVSYVAAVEGMLLEKVVHKLTRIA